MIDQMLEFKIDWETTENPYIFHARFNNEVVKLRLNDFPDEPLCTVFVGDSETNLPSFPKTWTLPRHRENDRS